MGRILNRIKIMFGSNFFQASKDLRYTRKLFRTTEALKNAEVHDEKIKLEKKAAKYLEHLLPKDQASLFLSRPQLLILGLF